MITVENIKENLDKFDLNEGEQKIMLDYLNPYGNSTNIKIVIKENERNVPLTFKMGDLLIQYAKIYPEEKEYIRKIVRELSQRFPILANYWDKEFLEELY